MKTTNITLSERNIKPEIRSLGTLKSAYDNENIFGKLKMFFHWYWYHSKRTSWLSYLNTKVIWSKEYPEYFYTHINSMYDDDLFNNLTDSFPPLGPIGNGMYHIGYGCYTGKEGWEEFEKQLKNEQFR